MNVSLIRHIADELVSGGYTALRFNFGGVGASGGSFTDGAEEPRDVAAAFEYLRSLDAVDPGRVSLAGWSFGSWMALMALAEGLPAASCVAIAPPLAAYNWWSSAPGIAASGTTRHYIVGDNDQFCSTEALSEFTSAVSPLDSENVVVLPSTDHFLFGREAEVAGLVAERLAP